MRLTYISSTGNHLALELVGDDTVWLTLNSKRYFAEHLIAKCPAFLPEAARDYTGPGQAAQAAVHLNDVVLADEWESFSQRVLVPLGRQQEMGRKAATARAMKLNREATAKGEKSPWERLALFRNQNGTYSTPF